MFIITASLPFRCIENRFFKLFCESLNPNFKSPSRQHVADLSNKFYFQRKEELKKLIEKVSIISLTTDCWNSVQNYSYIGLTGHFLDEKFKLKSILLSIRHLLGGHSAKNIGDYLKGIMDEFGIRQKVKFITTDNASTMTRMTTNLKIERIPCIGHILHLIIKNCLKSIKDNCHVSNEEIDNETEYVVENNPFYMEENLESTEKENLKIKSKITFQSHSTEFSIFNKGI